MQTVIASLAEAVTITTPEGDLIYLNDAAARLFGYGAAEETLAVGLDRMFADFELFDEDGGPFDPARLPGRRALAGEAPEPVTLMRRHRETGEERWLTVKASAIPDDDGRPMLAVNIVEDITAQRRAHLAAEFLAEASRMLSSSLDVQHTLRAVAEAAVPDIADWCAVELVDAGGVVEQVALVHVEPDTMPVVEELRERYPTRPDAPVGAPNVRRTGRSELYSELGREVLQAAAEDERHLELLLALDMSSVLVVPLRTPDQVLGTISFVTTGGRRLLTPSDLELAEELGRRAGVAVQNARIHQERSEIATTLQRSLLPPRLPVVPGAELAARFRAAGEANHVGGDFYDMFAMGDGWLLVIGDVTGKGPDAAATTSVTRHTLRTAALYESDPAALLGRLNGVLLDDPDMLQMCTVACLHLRTGPYGLTGELLCAGHPPPYLVRAGGEIEALCRPGPLLGAFRDASWEPAALELAPGDAVVLYTDGVTDARGRDGRFGAERLEALLRDAEGRGADEIAGAVDEALREFESGPQLDDVAVLVLRAGETRSSGESSLVAGSAASVR